MYCIENAGTFIIYLETFCNHLAKEALDFNGPSVLFTNRPCIFARGEKTRPKTPYYIDLEKCTQCGGLLNGTLAPNTDRLSIGGKSPLTGGIKEANAGGIAAQMLSKLGIKAIIVENKPADNEWFILKIDKNKAELLPIDKYVGLNNYG